MKAIKQVLRMDKEPYRVPKRVQDVIPIKRMDDLTGRDQRMMLAVLTLIHLADTKEQLDADTDALLKVGADHVGIVEKVENGRVYTIEGNTSDSCRQRSYPVGYYKILGYDVVRY